MKYVDYFVEGVRTMLNRDEPRKTIKCQDKKYTRSAGFLLKETHKSCHKAAAIIALNNGYH